MGLFNLKGPGSTASKAYKAHVLASQLRSKKNFAEAEKKFDEAFALYEQYKAEGGTESKYLSAYCMLLMRKGRFSEAKEILAACFKAPDATPDIKSNIRIDYAVCLWRLGELDKACDSIRRAVQVGVNTILYGTGGIIMIEQAKRTGDFAEAIEFNAKAFDYAEDDAGILDNMGQLALALAEKAEREGNTEEATAQYKKAFDFEKRAHEALPTQITSAYFYAKMLYERGEKEQAAEVLHRVDVVPVTAISEITPEMLDALRKQIF